MEARIGLSLLMNGHSDDYTVPSEILTEIFSYLASFRLQRRHVLFFSPLDPGTIPPFTG